MPGEKLSSQDFLKLYHGVETTKVKRNKYGNKKVKADGYTFDSKKEYNDYLVAKDRLQKGEIRNLVVHPKYLFHGLHTECGNTIYYEADLRWFEIATGEAVIQDSKGAKTEVYKLKKALMWYFFQIKIREV